MPVIRLTATDGTVLRAWCNERGGPEVLLCNCLCAPPLASPGVVARDSASVVVTWSQRGLGGVWARGPVVSIDDQGASR